MLVTFLLSKCSFTNYNHTPVSLVEVLSLALKFVGSRDQIEGNGYDDEGPTPRSGSASDIITVESSLQQWKAEIESDIWGQLNDRETIIYGIHVKHTIYIYLLNVTYRNRVYFDDVKNLRVLNSRYK